MVKKRILILSLIFVISLSFLSLTVSADTDILQPSSKDGFIYEQVPTSNFGTQQYFQVNPNGDEGLLQRSLVQFDLSGIPSGSQVSSATLKLWVRNTAGEGRLHWVYRVTQSWTEYGATWNTHDGTNPWSSAGGDYTAVDGASSTVPSMNNWNIWDVTNIVKAWIENSQPNYGFQIIDSVETETVSYLVQYDSRESEGFEQHPTLEITYIPAPVGGEGEIIHLNRLTLLTPYIIMAFITFAAFAGILYLKRMQ